MFRRVKVKSWKWNHNLCTVTTNSHFGICFLKGAIKICLDAIVPFNPPYKAKHEWSICWCIKSTLPYICICREHHNKMYISLLDWYPSTANTSWSAYWQHAYPDIIAYILLLLQFICMYVFGGSFFLEHSTLNMYHVYPLLKNVYLYSKI